MSKWKCEICGNRFDNFQAQGFDNKIYCPLCYFKKLSADLQVENAELKKQLKGTTHCYDEEEHRQLKEQLEELLNQKQEFIKFLEDEKDRLARKCSNSYEDSLGKTKLVNEDIFDEVVKIELKYKEIIGVSDD